MKYDRMKDKLFLGIAATLYRESRSGLDCDGLVWRTSWDTLVMTPGP